MAFRYDNPALDLLRAGPALALAGVTSLKQLYDIYTATEIKQLMTDYNMLSPSQKKEVMVQASRKRKVPYSKSKRPVKRRRTGVISKFQATGPQKDKRWVDVTSTQGFTTSTTNSTLLNGLVTGTDFYNRLGHNYVNTSIHFAGHILPNVTNPNDIISWAIVYDRQTNGAPPSWADVFQSTSNSGAQVNTPLAHFNIENSDRFMLIAHETRNMPSFTQAVGVTTAIGYIDPMQTVKINVFKYLKVPTRCDGDTANVADIVSGGIWLMTLGLNATASWSLNYSCRIRFES